MCIFLHLVCVLKTQNKMLSFFCIFCVQFLISGGVCVVDLSDIDNIGDDRYGGSYNFEVVILAINNASQSYNIYNILYYRG